jgi:putative phosphoribosyl transferase
VYDFVLKLPFRDRLEAARQLAAELKTRNLPKDLVVLALPRGGVPMGAEVAKELGAALDVVVVRKIGVPFQPELAMGAMAGNNVRTLDRDLIRQLGISDEDVEKVIAREARELERREKLYRSGRPAPDLRNRTAILVDDGLATGSTMVAAVEYVKSFQPASVIVAVPVGTKQASDHVRKAGAECVCLAMPEPFFAVGEWYEDFRQVEDLEVQNILARSAGAGAPAKP